MKHADADIERLQPAEDAMVVLDSSMTIMSYDQTAQRLFADRLKPGDLFNLEDYFGSHGAQSTRRALTAALEDGQFGTGLKAKIRNKNGQRLSCTYSVQPLYANQGNVIGAILCIQTSSALIAADALSAPSVESLQTPQCDHRELLEALPEGVFTINTRWRIASFNRTAEKITGYRREDVIGRHCWEIFRSDLCELGCPLKTALETGQTCTDQDVRILMEGGARQTILVNTGVLRDSSGAVSGAVETFRPLTGETLITKSTEDRPNFAEIIGRSEAMQRLFSMLPDVAASEANVLICGESGTGKELIAQTIHRHSPRNRSPFVAVNCAALAESLLESELFGHEKAAFTGATNSKPGRFELAKGGTIFFDEIGELKPELQIKLLRVLEQREFERVGGTRSIPMEARIISATNRDLKQALLNGSFREDFYYRLRTVPINIPPLRERMEDIPMLVDYFISHLNKRYKKEVNSVDPRVMQFFREYHWPGNVRELERTLEHAYVFVKGRIILPKDLPATEEFSQVADLPHNGFHLNGNNQSRETIIWALSKSGGKRDKASRLLGMSRTTLWRRMKELGLT